MMYRSQPIMKVAQSRYARPVRFGRRPISEMLSEGFLFALGITSNLVVHLVGDIFVAEILVIVTLPFLLALLARRLARPYLTRVFGLLGLWMLAQIVSNAYNHIVLEDQMRGMALIGFFAVEIAFFAMYVAGNERRKTIFLTAYVALTRFQPNIASMDLQETAEKWKWEYSYGITILALLSVSFLIARRRQVPAFIVLMAVSIVDLLMNFRSAFLMLLVTIVLVFPIIPERIGRLRLLPRKNNLLRVAIVGVLALVGGWTANGLLHMVTRSGLIGEEAQQKNESEAQAGNLLLGGRPEVFIGLRAAMDSPILGHGSWARNIKYIEMQYDMMQEYGIQEDLRDAEASERGLIPSHSHIIGAWVYAGFLGALFWIYIFWLVIKGLLVASVQRPRLGPIYIYVLVGYTWNIFFSPFGSTSRIFEAFTIVVIVDLLDGTRQAQIHQKTDRHEHWRRVPSWARRGSPAYLLSSMGHEWKFHPEPEDGRMHGL